MNLKYVPYKHTPPIVWLDTNVINEITDSVRDKEGLDPKRKEVFLNLYRTLVKAVNEGRIICPFSGQRTEYGDANDAELSDDVMMQLSKGFQISAWKIEGAQTRRMIEAYWKEGCEFTFIDSDLKYREKQESTNSLGLEVVILLERPERDRRKNLLDALKKRKEEVKELGLTYQQIYDSEFGARRQLIGSEIQKNIEIYGNFTLSPVENKGKEEQSFHTLFPLVVLKEQKGSDITPEELVLFFESEHYKSLPWDKINSTLISWILFEVEQLEVQHIGDISNISTILPYASIILTERQMAHILKASKLDIEFGTKIFNFKEIDKFISSIEAL